MARHRAVWGLIAVLAVVLALAGLGIFLLQPPTQEPLAPSQIVGTPPSTITSPAPAQVASTKHGNHMARAAEQIEGMYQRLAGGSAKDEELAAFRASILSGNPQQALAAIRDFLLSGQDAGTGEEFTLGEGGILEGAPTFRVLLLDLMGRVAKGIHSGEAAAFSRELLSEKKSADEWALAMRNIGWHEPTSKSFLATKAQELVEYGPWSASPTPGYLEAFDVFVYTASTSAIPLLTRIAESGSDHSSADLINDGEEPLGDPQRAATVALDRLSEAAPLSVMNYFNTHRDALAAKPFLRADYFAKADLRNDAQRAEVETYLGRGDVSAGEKVKVLDGLSSPASIITEALLSEPSIKGDFEPDLAAVGKTYKSWLDFNRFPTLRVEIQQALKGLPSR